MLLFRMPQCPATADELGTHVSAHPLAAQHLNRPKLGGRTYVCAAARASIHTVDLDNSQCPSSTARLSQPLHGIGVFEENVHWTRFPNNGVYALFDVVYLRCRQILH